MPLTRISTDALAPGLSSLARSIGAGQLAYDQGFQHQALAESRLGQAAAAARLHNLQADEVQGQLDARQPEAVTRNAMIAAGIPLDNYNDVQEFQRTGKVSRFEQPADGNAVAVPDWVKNLGSLGRQIMSFNNAAALGDKNSLNVAKATGEYRDQSLGDQVLQGKLSPLAVAASQYAVSGKSPYEFKEYGVGNNLTGEVDASGVPAQNYQALRQAETGKNTAQAGAARAAASNSYASADQHRAATTKINQDIQLGEKGTYDSARGGIVNTRTGQFTPVVGPDGQAIAPKDKDLTEGERKAASLLTRLRGSQQQMVNAIDGNERAQLPSTTAELLKKIGAESVANYMTPAARQKVEAAQLDMLDAALTLGTGAAYTREQLEGYRKSYFPQIGDSKQAIADKEVRLANILRAAEISASKGANLVPSGRDLINSSAPSPTGGRPQGRAGNNVIVDY